MDLSVLPAFGQIVIGPPGSGKTTYCHGMQQYMTKMGRKVAVVNLDPANDALPYECAVNISSLITLQDVMDMLKLGPNGGLVYCVEFLEKNFDWLTTRLQPLLAEQHYILFDCPGQVELYTHQNSIKNIFKMLSKLNLRLAAVHLVDSHYCGQPWKFIAVLLTSLATMLQIELPHINVLSKIDLIEQYDNLAFSLDFFTDVLDLSKLLDRFADDPFMKRYKMMNKVITEVVEDYSLVSFATLHIESEDSVRHLLKTVDKANGFMYGSPGDDHGELATSMSSAAGAEPSFFQNPSAQK